MEILSAIFCLILGAGVTFLLLRPKIIFVKKNTQTQEEAIKNAAFELQLIEEKTQVLKTQYNEKLDEYTRIQKDIDEEFSLSKERIKQHYQNMIDNYNNQYLDFQKDIQQTYLDLAEELVEDFLNIQKKQQNETEKLNTYIQKEQELLDDLRKKTAAAVEANKRILEIQEQENFYKLILTQNDLEEIAELRKILSHFRNPEPVNKVIWKTYYEKPYSDLIGRVVGSEVRCGIYKITNLQNKKCYVGQSTNIAERWKQHIKRGLGADTPTRNKLYPIMASVGVENFSFEIIEECRKDQLNEREIFWQEYFKAKSFGYSIK